MMCNRLGTIYFVVVILAAILLASCGSQAFSLATYTPVAGTPTVTATIRPEITGKLLATATRSVDSTGNLLAICRGRVNIRACPSRSCRWLGSLEPGAVVTPLGQRDGWTQIGAGWIYSKFVCKAGK